MVLTRIDIAPFVEPIDLEDITAEALLRIPADRVALVEHITPPQIPRLAEVLREAWEVAAATYLGERPDLPTAVLVPIIYVLTDPGEVDGADREAIAATGAVPIDPAEWEDEQAALKPLLAEPLPS